MAGQDLILAQEPLQRIPRDILDLLGDHDFLTKEDRARYHALLLAVGNQVEARSIVDWIAVDDVAYHRFDGQRLKGIRSQLLKESQVRVVEELLMTTLDGPEQRTDELHVVFDAKTEARKWAGGGAFTKKLDAVLAARGYDRAVIEAKAYALCASQLSDIDRSIADREVRRMISLSELARSRSMFAKRLQAADQVIEGKFTRATAA